MVKREKTLEGLKRDYLEIQKKYGLPEFDELNREFQIEKISEIETDFLIKEIRKLMGDRLASYMRFVENLLNPVNVPMFVFSMVKLLDSEDKKVLQEIYKKLIEMEISFIELDIEFNEKKEIEFIKHNNKTWKLIRKDLLKIMNKINKKRDDKSEVGDKGYFG